MGGRGHPPAAAGAWRRARFAGARAGRARPPPDVRVHDRRPRNHQGDPVTTAAAGATAEIAGVEVSTAHLIGGRRVGTRERFAVISPIDGDVVAQVAAGGPDEVDQAVRAARGAFPAWAALGASGRAELLHRLADLIDANVERLAIVECTDMAMLLRSLRARVIKRGALNYRAYADLATAYEERDWRSRGTWNRVQRMPSGPAGVITPWNAPFMLSTWKTAPALPAGCTRRAEPARWAPPPWPPRGGP